MQFYDINFFYNFAVYSRSLFRFYVAIYENRQYFSGLQYVGVCVECMEAGHIFDVCQGKKARISAYFICSTAQTERRHQLLPSVQEVVTHFMPYLGSLSWTYRLLGLENK